MGFDFEIQYRPGLENKAADALSRCTEGVSIVGLSMPTLLDVTTITHQVDADPYLCKVKQKLLKDPDSYPRYSLSQGRLLYKGRLVVSKTSDLIPLLLREFRSSAMGGHSGFLRTYKQITADLYWQGMKQDIKWFVEECSVCQQNKTQSLTPAGLLQPLPIPLLIWDDITMDFVEGLPKSRGFDSIMAVVNKMSKYAHFSPLKHPYTAHTVASTFMRDIVRLHGIPRSIISDRDKVFMSQFWQELFKLQGTLLRHSTAHHPQTDGQSEVVNQCLEAYLRCFSSDQPRKWQQWLAWAEYPIMAPLRQLLFELFMVETHLPLYDLDQFLQRWLL